MLYVLAGGSAVALSMLIMSIFNAEHPPASSIALGFVINDWDPHTVLLVLAGISLISLIKQLLKDRIIDLYTD
jgi:CBS-domain-containing membrane protein